MFAQGRVASQFVLFAAVGALPCVLLLSSLRTLRELDEQKTVYLRERVAEIGELDGALQAKLLRVLQEKTFERVGRTRQIAVDVRLLTATNRNLTKLVSEGKFREDLYYRLNTFPIEIPPLDRVGDLPALAKFFLERAAAILGRKAPMLSSEAIDRMRSYTWPGNVRELENMMERVVIRRYSKVKVLKLLAREIWKSAMKCEDQATPNHVATVTDGGTGIILWGKDDRAARLYFALFRENGV